MSDEQEPKQKKERKTPRWFAEAFMENWGYTTIDGHRKQKLRYWRGDYYMWSKNHYVRSSKDEISALLVRLLEANCPGMTTKELSDILMHLKALAYTSEERQPDAWLTGVNEPTGEFALLDQIIGYKDGKITAKPASPDFFTLSALPYAYDPLAGCPRWIAFLEEVTRGDKELQRLLQQWAGYLLTPTQRHQVFMLLIGEAATGKGTFARTMEAMLGRESCSAVPLRRFTSPFSLAATYGKKLNIVSDAEQELTPQGEAVIKAWTGEDGLDFERKYRDSFSAVATAKLMILANNFPTFTDKSMGTWRRLKIVPFDRDNKDYRDEFLQVKLNEELPGILNWALAGLMDLEKERTFCEPKASRAMWTEFKEESNPAGLFLAENYGYDPGFPIGVPVSEVYAAYRKWCKVKGYQTMSDRTFGKEVKRAFPKVVKRRLGNKESRQYRYSYLVYQPGAEIRKILNASNNR